MLSSCPVCGKTEFFEGLFNAQDSHVVIRPDAWTFTTGVKPRAMVCLSCGSVHLYLDGGELERVRQWRADGK